MMEFKKMSVDDLQAENKIKYCPFPLINAVISLQQEGKAFFGIDQKSGPFFVLHKAGFSYLFIKESSVNFEEIIHFFITSDELPSYFHVYDSPQALMNLCEKKHEWINYKIRNRVQLKYFQKDINIPALPIGYHSKKISSDNINALEVFGVDIGKKFWRSTDDFLQNGFGFCVSDQSGQPVSLCYTACMINNTAEIDVATIAEFRQKGLAKIAVGKFVSYCILNNIIANWDCFEDNHGSLKTALSLGFTNISTYPFLSIFNKKKQHENN